MDKRLESLIWQMEAGADDSVGETCLNALAPRPAKPIAVSAPVSTPTIAPTVQVSGAQISGVQAQSLEALRDELESFEGCALKQPGRRLVLADGNPKAPVMFIGEGPGEEEDQQGLPFVGPSGRLLDRMLAAIGLDRSRSISRISCFGVRRAIARPRMQRSPPANPLWQDISP